MMLYLITFLAGFLLFQIELIIAKVFLPNYGGSYLVWGACIVFFQAVLLSGYVFAHLLNRRLGIQNYLKLHVLLLLLPFAFFPGRDLELKFFASNLPLTIDIFLRLWTTIGPVFFVLSTISLVTQSWWAHADIGRKVSPYRLYAVSNIGSFAGLFSYPFFFEYMLDVSDQLSIWRILYVVLVVAHLAALWFVRITDTTVVMEKEKFRAGFQQSAEWLILGAAGVVLFMSVSHLITAEIAPMPLLWVIPLGIYLLSFVLNFKERPSCPRFIETKIHYILGLTVFFYYIAGQQLLPAIISLIIFSLLLFALCMYCQNQLIRRKPADKAQMTFYYVMISLGGFLGGVLCSWIIPVVYEIFVELFIGLLLLTLISLKLPDSKRTVIKPLLLSIALIGIYVAFAYIFKDYNLFALLGLGTLTLLAFHRLKRCINGLFVFFVVFLVLFPAVSDLWIRSLCQNPVYLRNYYGIYLVYDNAFIRNFSHGSIIHGGQIRAKGLEDEPIMYYIEDGPIGDLLANPELKFKKVGVVGLGIGMLSTYMHPGQELDYYELDPDVVRLAQDYFTFMKRCLAKQTVTLGDARIALDATDRKYDILIIDAFSGDSIPFHLLTVEMMEKYKEHLNPGGVLVVHYSNFYVHLLPVLNQLANAADLKLMIKDQKASDISFPCSWSAFTANQETVKKLRKRGWEEPLNVKDVRVWTDEYSSVLPLVNRRVIDTVTGFNIFNPERK